MFSVYQPINNGGIITKFECLTSFGFSGDSTLKENETFKALNNSLMDSKGTILAFISDYCYDCQDKIVDKTQITTPLNQRLKELMTNALFT